MALKFTTHMVGDVSILRLDGRIVLGEESSSLEAIIRSLISDQRRKIILNVANVTFLDSAGNGKLAAAHHYIRSKGGVLKLCHLGGKLLETLQVTKLLSIYDCYYTEADALKSFDSPSLYCFCPACGERCGPSRTHAGYWVEQSCNNPSCGAQFSIGDSQRSKDLASITRLTFQTYQNESFEIRADHPFKCQILGRLDLFSSSALQKSWLAIPSPRRVVFDLQRTTEINDAGRTALITLLAGKEDGSKATVSLEGLGPEQMAAFPNGAPFFRRMADALKSLGNVSDSPRWQARIIEESRLPA
jgi:anti-sigma B factor antagonist